MTAPTDTGVGRLRPGQPARRGPRRRTGRPDGRGGARGRRPPGAEAVDSIRVVNMLSWRYRDPGRLLGAAHRRRRRRHPLHRRRRQRAADAGQPGVPGHPGGPRRCGADRRRRNLAHPNADAQPGRQAGLDEPGRVGAVRRGRQRAADGRGRRRLRIGLDRPAYVYPLFEQALRIDGGESPERSPQANRRTVGAVQRCGPRQSARVEPQAVDRRADLAAGAGQPDDQLALHQADELQQHGRPGRGASS